MRNRTLLFGLYSLGLLAANAAVLRALFDLSRADETASHLVLIPFVSLVLIYIRRDAIFSVVRPAWPLGAGIILLGLALSLWGRVVSPGSMSVAAGGLVLCWVGGFLAFYGGKAFRSALFPLLFLAFMIPMPPGLVAVVTRFLKIGSTEVVAVLFSLTGTPTHRDGFIFALPNFTIEVADECSGIRSSLALLLTGLLAGHMFLRNWWTKALFAAVIVPFAILKNGIRIVSLSLLAEHVDPGYLTGQLHHEGGIVFFLLTLAMLAPLFVLLQRADAKHHPEESPA